MFKVIEGDTRGLADVGKFIDLINDPPGEARDLFDPGEDIFVARAPGRLDVMGGIADYSGSLVLEMPIKEATLAAVQKSNDNKIRIVSLQNDTGRSLVFETDLPLIASSDLSYAGLRNFFSQDPDSHWASYVAGVFPVLGKELGSDLHRGARILISSDIPIGKGVSSSAAIEVAAMQAVCAAYKIQMAPLDFAMLCQKVENLVVGAPCGVMDQVTSHCGEENSLLEILCQPAEIVDSIAIPPGIEFWGIDSGVLHAVGGFGYAAVRAGAFMGYRMIAGIAKLNVRKTGEISDFRWRGYLANITPREYTDRFENALPVELKGSEFLDSYEGTTDTVTKIDPGKTYPVKAPTEHGIMECARVREFSERLKTHGEVRGDLMFQSHASYAACGLTEPGTDRIAGLVKENAGRGLHGARITGGGSGGTVAVAARAGSEDVIREIADKYERQTGLKPYIFHGSSPGCAAFGYLRLRHGSA